MSKADLPFPRCRPPFILLSADHLLESGNLRACIHRKAGRERERALAIDLAETKPELKWRHRPGQRFDCAPRRRPGSSVATLTVEDMLIRL